MLKFLLALVIAVVIFIVLYSARVMVLVCRFLIEMDLVSILRENFFGSNNLYELYKDSPMSISVGEETIDFDNFLGGVNFLEEYAKMLLEDYKKIIDLTDYYELSSYEQILKETITDVRMWRWKHNGIEKNETDS